MNIHSINPQAYAFAPEGFYSLYLKVRVSVHIKACERFRVSNGF